MMKDFLEGLEMNANNIISEAQPLDEATGGKTFKELADSTTKWGYIPKPKEGKGFGTAKNSLLFIKENSENSWDIYVMKKAATGKSAGTASDKSAASAVLGRDLNKSEAKEMEYFMAITESVVNGSGILTESSGKIEGNTSMLNDETWVSTKVLSNLEYADLLNKCISVVESTNGKGAKSFIS